MFTTRHQNKAGRTDLATVWRRGFRARLEKSLAGSVRKGAELVRKQAGGARMTDAAINHIAQKQAREAIAQIDRTTARRLAAGKDAFADSAARSEMIAQTETSAAFHSGMLLAASRIGGLEKQWVCDGPNPCPVCLDIEAQGPIGLDEAWGTDEGEIDAPPQHPVCACSLSLEAIR